MNQNNLLGGLLGFAFLKELDGMGLAEVREANAVGLTGYRLALIDCLLQKSVLVIAFTEECGYASDSGTHIVAVREHIQRSRFFVVYKERKTWDVVFHEKRGNRETAKMICFIWYHPYYSQSLVGQMGCRTYCDTCFNEILGIFGMIASAVGMADDHAHAS